MRELFGDKCTSFKQAQPANNICRCQFHGLFQFTTLRTSMRERRTAILEKYLVEHPLRRSHHKKWRNYACTPWTEPKPRLFQQLLLNPCSTINPDFFFTAGTQLRRRTRQPPWAPTRLAFDGSTACDSFQAYSASTVATKNGIPSVVVAKRDGFLFVIWHQLEKSSRKKSLEDKWWRQ